MLPNSALVTLDHESVIMKEITNASRWFILVVVICFWSSLCLLSTIRLHVDITGGFVLDIVTILERSHGTHSSVLQRLFQSVARTEQGTRVVRRRISSNAGCETRRGWGQVVAEASDGAGLRGLLHQRTVRQHAHVAMGGVVVGVRRDGRSRRPGRGRGRSSAVVVVL